MSPKKGFGSGVEPAHLLPKPRVQVSALSVGAIPIPSKNDRNRGTLQALPRFVFPLECSFNGL